MPGSQMDLPIPAQAGAGRYLENSKKQLGGNYYGKMGLQRMRLRS